MTHAHGGDKEVRKMSNKNYSKYFNNETVTEVKEAEVKEPEVIESVTTEEPISIDSTAELPEVPTQGYLSVEDVTTEEITLGETVTEVVEEVDSTGNTVEDVAGESVEDPEVLLLVGIVSGCIKLNVRAEAKKEATILCVLDKGTEVTLLDSEEVSEDFYKVCTKDGVEGYCMKKFIEIK